MAAKDELLEMAGGEKILGVVIGPAEWPSRTAWPGVEGLIGELLPWSRAAAVLDVEGRTFRGGLGHMCCPSMYAWTESWVILVDEYDGSTELTRIPRSPVACVPGYGGKG